jgi:hypothetical protein
VSTGYRIYKYWSPDGTAEADGTSARGSEGVRRMLTESEKLGAAEALLVGFADVIVEEGQDCRSLRVRSGVGGGGARADSR